MSHDERCLTSSLFISFIVTLQKQFFRRMMSRKSLLRSSHRQYDVHRRSLPRYPTNYRNHLHYRQPSRFASCIDCCYQSDDFRFYCHQCWARHSRSASHLHSRSASLRFSCRKNCVKARLLSRSFSMKCLSATCDKISLQPTSLATEREVKMGMFISSVFTTSLYLHSWEFEQWRIAAQSFQKHRSAVGESSE